MKNKTIVNGITLPRILYHGTTKWYHDETISRLGIYNNSYDVVYTSAYFVTPCGYAFTRARQYKGGPLLLVIDTEKAKVGFIPDEVNTMQPKFKFLPKESYLQMRLIENDEDLANKINKAVREILNDGNVCWEEIAC